MDTRSSADIVHAYHARTKHCVERYAAGPETLDWTARPDPFRTLCGTSLRIALPLGAAALATPFGHVYEPGAPQPLTLGNVAALLELSFALSACKEYGPDRWALRCNPASGNLHPTEVYVLARNIDGLDDGLYSYASREHALELRCRVVTTHAPNGVWLALSSIHRREAWKYGARAFRYCQLDVGHAIGAARYAAGVLGWSVHAVDACASRELATLLGLDRAQDFAGAAREEPDLLLAASPEPAAEAPAFEAVEWGGHANLLAAHPMYSWPVIDEVAAASEKIRAAPDDFTDARYPAPIPATAEPATRVILRRRSAQRYDNALVMGGGDFYHMLDRLLARRHTPRVHPLLFVHSVEGLASGRYILPRTEAAEVRLRAALKRQFVWRRVEGSPHHLPLHLLQPGRWRQAARTLSCHQAIAADGCFALAMSAEVEGVVRPIPGTTANCIGRQACWATCGISKPRRQACAARV